MSMEAGDYAFYEANELNQYTDITGSEDEADFSFTPEFDADGNQTSIKTETGIWTTVYNAENRPVSFTNEATSTVVICAYDSMGRRSFKKATVNGTVTLHQRYLYRGYQQIACIDLTRSHHPCLWLITWDPNQPAFTRPLAIQKNGTWYTYGIDLSKNICEVYSSTGTIFNSYVYTPTGKESEANSFEQPLLWSSEYKDKEIALVYYNFRYYNPTTGKWLSRDLLDENNEKNRYLFNASPLYIDLLGMKAQSVNKSKEEEKRSFTFFGNFTASRQLAHESFSIAVPVEGTAKGTLTRTLESDNTVSVSGIMSFNHTYSISGANKDDLCRQGFLSKVDDEYTVSAASIGFSTADGRTFSLPTSITSEYKSGRGQYAKIGANVNLTDTHPTPNVSFEVGGNCAKFYVLNMEVSVDIMVNNKMNIGKQTLRSHDIDYGYGATVKIKPDNRYAEYAKASHMPYTESSKYSYSFGLSKAPGNDAIWSFGVTIDF